MAELENERLEIKTKKRGLVKRIHRFFSVFGRLTSCRKGQNYLVNKIFLESAILGIYKIKNSLIPVIRRERIEKNLRADLCSSSPLFIRLSAISLPVKIHLNLNIFY